MAGSNGRTVPLVAQGSGPKILIVHGGSGDLTAWAAVANRLAANFTVTRFSRYLYRGDPPTTGVGAMSEEAADLLAVADSIGGPLIVVGHSSGAIVTLEAALSAPPGVAGLVLYEPPLAVTEPLGGPALVRARAALDAGKPVAAMRIHLRDLVRLPRPLVALVCLLPPTRSWLRRFAAGQIADDEAIESLGTGIDRYRSVSIPVLLLGGERSPEHLRERLAALGQVLPGVESTVLLPGQGHGANARAPEQVVAVIRDFAARILPPL